MKVFVLLYRYYDDSEFYGVFSSQEKAEAEIPAIKEAYKKKWADLMGEVLDLDGAARNIAGEAVALKDEGFEVVETTIDEVGVDGLDG
jgi:hypothetical protein